MLFTYSPSSGLNSPSLSSRAYTTDTMSTATLEADSNGTHGIWFLLQGQTTLLCGALQLLVFLLCFVLLLGLQMIKSREALKHCLRRDPTLQSCSSNPRHVGWGTQKRIRLLPPASDATQGPTKVHADSRHRYQLHAGQLSRLNTARRYTVFSSLLTVPPPPRDTLVLPPQHSLQLTGTSLFL